MSESTDTSAQMLTALAVVEAGHRGDRDTAERLSAGHAADITEGSLLLVHLLLSSIARAGGHSVGDVADTIRLGLCSTAAAGDL